MEAKSVENEKARQEGIIENFKKNRREFLRDQVAEDND